MRVRSLLSFSVIVLFLSACGTPAPVAPVQQVPAVPPTAAPPPTEAIPPTPTEIPPTPTPSVQQFFTEEFDNGMEHWIGLDVDGNNGVIADNGLPSAVITADAGSMLFDLQRTWVWAYRFYEAFEYKDVRLEASFKNQGTNNNNISLVCRYVPDVGWYEFNVANNGLYWIYNAEPRADGYVRYKLLSEGGSNVIKQGQAVNEYAITCQGSTLTLFINGKMTKQVEDSSRSSGKVGLSVSSFASLPVKVGVEWVKISEP